LTFTGLRFEQNTNDILAGTFTQNKIQGATVRLCKQRLAGAQAQAVIVNSGNANACTLFLLWFLEFYQK